MPGYGAAPDKARVVFIGEAPGSTEIRTGRPFVGPSGRLLRSICHKVGFDILSCKDAIEGGDEPEVYFTNAALCPPSYGDIDTYKTTSARKIAARRCFNRLKQELQPYAEAGVPMCALGGSSSMVMVGNVNITQIRSRWWSKGPVRILTTWHPAYILRQPNKAGELIRDLQKVEYGRSKWDDIKGETVTYTVLENEEDIWRFARELSDDCRSGKIQDSTVCIDIESDNVEWWQDELLCIGFAWSTTEAAIIPRGVVYEDCTREALIWLFDQQHIKWVGHNFKFDCRFIRHQLKVPNVRVDYDSLIADYVNDENRWHALKRLLTEFYDVPDYEEELIQRYLKNKNDRYSKVPMPLMYKYCAYDVVYTVRLWRDERKWLEERGLFEQPFLYPLMASMEAFLDIELRGMLIDKRALLDLSLTLHSQLDAWHVELCEIAQVKDFNPNSPKQVSAIMYGRLKMPKQKIRGLKPISTAAPVRKMIMQQYTAAGAEESRGYKWILLYDGWKSLEKIRSSYVDNMIPLIDSTGRVHPDILVHGTETGRLSIRNPALQTIPRTDTGRVQGEMWGMKIKQCFNVLPGYKMVQVDYSQAELRTAASLSNDPFLIKCYMDDRDIHGEVANEFWPGWLTMTDQVEKKFRRKRTKMCVFGRLYKGTAYTIAETMHCGMSQAKKYLAILDEKLDGLVDYEHAQLALMKQQGYVSTLTGRRRRMPLINKNNIDDAGKASAVGPVQGTAADLTLMSTIEVHQWVKKRDLDAHILVTVHDCITLEVREDLVEEVAVGVRNIMEDVGKRWMPNIPWKADIEVGDNWGEPKEVSY